MSHMLASVLFIPCILKLIKDRVNPLFPFKMLILIYQVLEDYHNMLIFSVRTIHKKVFEKLVLAVKVNNQSCSRVRLQNMRRFPSLSAFGFFWVLLCKGSIRFFVAHKIIYCITALKPFNEADLVLLVRLLKP